MLGTTRATWFRLTDNIIEELGRVGIINRGGPAGWDRTLEVGAAADVLGSGWLAKGDVISHEFART